MVEHSVVTSAGSPGCVYKDGGTHFILGCIPRCVYKYGEFNSYRGVCTRMGGLTWQWTHWGMHWGIPRCVLSVYKDEGFLLDWGVYWSIPRCLLGYTWCVHGYTEVCAVVY